MKSLPAYLAAPIVLALIFGGRNPCLAQASAESRLEELFVARLPLAQERGELQLGSTVHAHRLAGRAVTDLPFDVELGITNSLQLELEVGGMRYADRWSGPGHGSLGLLYARRGILPRFDLGISLQAEAEGRDGISQPSWSSMLLAAWRPTEALQFIVNTPTAPASCEEDDDDVAPTALPEPRCAFAAVASLGRFHLDAEVPLRSLSAPRAIAVVPGLTVSVAGFQIGAAALAPVTAGATGYSGVRFHIVRDF